MFLIADTNVIVTFFVYCQISTNGLLSFKALFSVKEALYHFSFFQLFIFSAFSFSLFEPFPLSISSFYRVPPGSGHPQKFAPFSLELR